MKNKLFWLSTVLLHVLCPTITAQNSSASIITSAAHYENPTTRTANITIEATNNYIEARTDVPIVIDLSALKLNFTVKDAIVQQVNNGGYLDNQIDDLDGDRKGDELVFVAHFKPRETITFKIELSSKTYLSAGNSPAPRTHAQMYAYDKTLAHDLLTSVTTPGNSNIYSALLHHGPAFESELVGYRIYFNEWQTVDPYGKRSKRLELQDTKFYTTKAQLAQDYGDDVLRVGQTVSVGTLKGYDAQKNTVLPFTPVEYITETVVASGPVRSVVMVKNEGWLYEGKQQDITTYYILYAGHRDVEVRVQFSIPQESQTYCTGVMRKAGDRTFSDHAGLIGTWSIDFPQNDTIAYQRDTVGLATFVHQSIITGETTTPANPYGNNLYLINLKDDKEFKYYFTFTSKREREGFASADEWFAYLRRWKASLLSPINISVKQ